MRVETESFEPADAQLVEELYWWTLCRPPSAQENERALAHFKSYDVNKRNEAAQDLLWVLLNQKDFLFNR